MELLVPEASPSMVADLVKDLDTIGYSCIENYISPEQLARMQRFVSDAVTRANDEYVHFNGPEQVRGSGLDELADAAEFKALMRRVYELGTNKPAPAEPFHQVLRCLCGASGQSNSYIFHYDSYLVTALIPIQIPTSGETGDLLMYPNTRRVHTTYLRNALDKVLLDNPLTQRVLRAAAKGSLWNPVRIRMTPGNLYFFWGYRSIHTNEPCDPDKIRATALFHYVNPHRKVVVKH